MRAAQVGAAQSGAQAECLIKHFIRGAASRQSSPTALHGVVAGPRSSAPFLINGALITLSLIQGALVTLSQWHPATAWVPLGACSCSLPAAPGSRPHCSLTPKQPVPTGHAISTAPQTPQAACLPAAVSSQQPHPPQVALSLSTPRPPPRPRPRPTRRPPAPQTSQLRAPPSRTDFAPYSA